MPYMDMELFSIAKANGVKLNAANSKGENLYLLTVKYMPMEALTMIIDSVENINIADNGGSNALEYAIRRANLNGSTDAEKAKETYQIVLFLIENGVKVVEGEKFSTIGFVFQNHLSFNGDLQVLLTKLIEAGAKANKVMYGRTPLQLLIGRLSIVVQYPELLDVLLKAGAEINAVYKDQTVLDMIKVPPMREDISEAEKTRLASRIKEYYRVIDKLISYGAKHFNEL